LIHGTFKPAKLNYNQKIPKQVIQTAYEYPKLTEMLNTISSIKETNPEYVYRFFDDKDARKYIQDNFNENINFAYENLIPGAFKADLFRYCILYNEGGIYMDCKMISVVPFRDIIGENDELILVKDDYQMKTNNIPGIYNAFICTVAGKETFYQTIEAIVKHVFNHFYPENPFLITGPTLLLNCYCDEGKFLIHPFNGHSPTDHNNCIVNDKNEILIYKTYKNQHKQNYSGKYILDYAYGRCYKNILDLFIVYDFDFTTLQDDCKKIYDFEFAAHKIRELKVILNDYKIVIIDTVDDGITEFDGLKAPSKLKLTLVENKYAVGEGRDTQFFIN